MPDTLFCIKIKQSTVVIQYFANLYKCLNLNAWLGSLQAEELSELGS